MSNNNQPRRAEWWREVTDPTEIIEKGRWFRVESDDFVSEVRASSSRLRSDLYKGRRIFVDSRRQPPLKVGDEVTTSAQLDLLPIKAVVKDAEDDVWQARTHGWVLAVEGSSPTDSDELADYGPATILWLPEGEN